MNLEIVTTTCDETICSENSHADRVELVSGITEGALTPTLGSLLGVKKYSKLPAFCMIRPHNHGFVYSDHDIEEMKADIVNQRDHADALVLGVLNEQGEIDEAKLDDLLSVCGDAEVVFHKAIDQTSCIRKSIDILSAHPQVKRILTNFKQNDIANNLEEVKANYEYALSKGLKVTFAGGIQLETIPFLKQIGATDVHISSAARIDKLAKNKLDPARIEAFKKACE